MEETTSTRTYWTFRGVSRVLHQSVNTGFDVRQSSFESATLVRCLDGEGTTTTLGKGWLCCTVVQNGDSNAPKGQPQQGFMSLDVTVEDILDNLFVRGMVVNNKNVSSVVGQGKSGDSSLLTVISEPDTLQVTFIRHHTKFSDSIAQASSSGASLSSGIPSSSSSVSASVPSTAALEERRARAERHERKKHQHQQQQQQQANSVQDGAGQMRVSGGGDRDPRVLNRPKDRRSETDGSPLDKRPKTHHEPKTAAEHTPRHMPMEHNPTSDPVGFLNYSSHAPLTDHPGSDGALLQNETAGFGDAEERPEELGSRAPSPARGNSGTEAGADAGVRASTSATDDGGDDEHVTPSTSSGLSNRHLPPNSQASSAPLSPHPRSPHFEDIIQSLTRLINECGKGDRVDTPAPSRRTPECSDSHASPAATSTAATAAAATTVPVCEAPRPVCEIRPYMVNTAAAPQPPPEPQQPAANRRTRGGARPRNGSRGGGGGRRGASTSGRRRRRNQDDESEDEILPGPSRRRSVPPSFAEDGLEIIDLAEEAALAAASIASFFD
ncbi:Rh144/Rh145 [macacine betaherpesvirus 3]|nr:Rh144/Rh145 [macacine betaherpesvirus 3]APT40366.1 Rh144/Rh145 [macacine betaherpesvirus 3]